MKHTIYSNHKNNNQDLYDEEALIDQNLIPDFKPKYVRCWYKNKNLFMICFLIIYLLIMICMIIFSILIPVKNDYEMY